MYIQFDYISNLTETMQMKHTKAYEKKKNDWMEIYLNVNS